MPGRLPDGSWVAPLPNEGLLEPVAGSLDAPVDGTRPALGRLAPVDGWVEGRVADPPDGRLTLPVEGREAEPEEGRLTFPLDGRDADPEERFDDDGRE